MMMKMLMTSSPDGAADGVEAFAAVVGGGEVFVHAGRGVVELHVRGDGGADQGHGKYQESVAAQEVRPHQVGKDLMAVGVPEKRRDRVGQKCQRQHQKQPLGTRVGAHDGQDPNKDGGDGHRDARGDTEDLHRGADPGEFTDGQPGVGDEQQRHREEGGAGGKLFADQPAQPFAGVDAQP